MTIKKIKAPECCHNCCKKNKIPPQTPTIIRWSLHLPHTHLLAIQQPALALNMNCLDKAQGTPKIWRCSGIQVYPSVRGFLVAEIQISKILEPFLDSSQRIWVLQMVYLIKTQSVIKGQRHSKIQTYSSVLCFLVALIWINKILEPFLDSSQRLHALQMVYLIKTQSFIKS